MKELFILPNEIKVGFAKVYPHQDKLEVPLGFATFTDKGKLRKEKSWEQWHDKEIEPLTVKNEALLGFTISGTAQRSNEWFGTGRHTFRITDPRGFQLEITPENLLSLLSHTIVNNGSILAKCIWIWSKGGKLALITENSDLYGEAVNFTKIRSTKISMRDVKPGDTVLTQDDKTVKYLGTFNFIRFHKKYSPESGYVGSYNERLYYKGKFTQVKRAVYIDKTDENREILTFASSLKPAKILRSCKSEISYLDFVQHIIKAQSAHDNNFDAPCLTRFKVEDIDMSNYLEFSNVSMMMNYKYFVHVSDKPLKDFTNHKIQTIVTSDQMLQNFTPALIETGRWVQSNVFVTRKDTSLGVESINCAATKDKLTLNTTQYRFEIIRNQIHETHVSNRFGHSMYSRATTKEYDPEEIVSVKKFALNVGSLLIPFNPSSSHATS